VTVFLRASSAIEWCEQIVGNPASAVFAARKAVVQGLKLPLAEGLRLEGRHFAEINASEEARKMNAAMERPS
jgi:enoyl-CoA hydratase/carnithine racemase